MVARANHRVTYPSRIQLVAAMNPCRCGKAGEPGHRLPARPALRRATTRRASPARCIDRIDIRIEVPALAASDLIRPGAERDERRRGGARRRGARASRASAISALGSKVRCNAQAGADLIETVATPERAGMRLLEDAAAAMQLTARGYHRVLKLARTLADLDGAETVARIHIAEALSYRALPLDLAAAALSRRAQAVVVSVTCNRPCVMQQPMAMARMRSMR